MYYKAVPNVEEIEYVIIFILLYNTAYEAYDRYVFVYCREYNISESS